MKKTYIKPTAETIDNISATIMDASIGSGNADPTQPALTKDATYFTDEDED